jgi:DNA-binding MarR family transcriptional regulator
MPEPSRLRRLDSLLDMPLYRFSRLLAEAGSLVVRLCEGRFGITRREWRVLSYLATTEGMTPSALAAHAGLDKGQASRVIQSLTVKELVLRTSRPSDRRHAMVHLTQRGRELHDQVLPLTQRINRELLDALSAEEVDWLDGVLDRLQAQSQSLVASYDAQWPRTPRFKGRTGRSR